MDGSSQAGWPMNRQREPSYQVAQNLGTEHGTLAVVIKPNCWAALIDTAEAARCFPRRLFFLRFPSLVVRDDKLRPSFKLQLLVMVVMRGARLGRLGGVETGWVA